MNNSENANNVLIHHQNTSEKFSAFLKPLRENFGINSFCYRGFKGNKTYINDTDKSWIELSLEREFYNLHYYKDEIIQVGNKQMHVVFRNDNNNIISKFARRHGFFHELSIYKKTGKDSIEMWHFRTDQNNGQIVNSYLNNIALINRFIFYIKSEIPSLFNFSNDNYILSDTNFSKLLASEPSSEDQLSIEKFINDTKIQKFRVFEDESILITARETECLYFLSLGQSIKKIARSLNISPRTVEKHLCNLKNKFGSANKFEQIRTYTNRISDYFKF